ncbi:MAG TPA: Hg(II)-responsive transcriptional regulator [Psychromonas sp.]
MSFTIGRLAKLADVNIETIRFYERKGLLKQPIKPLTGYRQYDDQALSRIRFVKRAQEVGFTLGEIQSLLDIESNSCNEVQHLATEKLALTRQKIADLQRLEKTLQHLVIQCEITENKTHCPIVDSFNKTASLNKK